MGPWHTTCSRGSGAGFGAETGSGIRNSVFGGAIGAGTSGMVPGRFGDTNGGDAGVVGVLLNSI